MYRTQITNRRCDDIRPPASGISAGATNDRDGSALMVMVAEGARCRDQRPVSLKELPVKRVLSVGLVIAFLTTGTGFAQTSTSDQPPPVAHRPMPSASDDVPPFSRMSVGTGISPLGIGIQVSTDLNKHLNLRGSGAIFKYNTSFNLDGFPMDANVNLASGGVAVDYYPFHLGWRLTGVILFVNDNQISSTMTVPSGNYVTINGTTYYSANTNPATGAAPLTGTGSLYLNGLKPGAVLTTGWGNHVKRRGHWTFPFEIGAAFVGSPKIGIQLGGWACTDAAQTHCTNIAEPQNPIAQKFQSDLQAQIHKWNDDIHVLEAYPVISFGVAYSFQLRNK